MKKPLLLSDKHGVFYLLLVSIMVGVMIFIFLAYKEYSYTDRQKVVETRIRTINDFIRSIDSDSGRVIYISGFRSLISLEDYVARSGQYLDHSEDLFRIAFYNGTVNDTQVDVLVNSTYADYLDKLRLIAGMIGLDIDINVIGINLYHQSPWSVTVDVIARINITDQKGLAKWDFTKVYTTNVSIISIRDPVYSVATLGRVPNTIRNNDSITDYVDHATNDTTNLMLLVNNSFYVANPLAPSFLMRLEGNFSSSPYGIESFVDIPELQDVEYSSSKSIIDYILFSNITGYENVSCVKGTPLWFKIDSNHTTQYEVEHILTTCP